MCKWRERIAEDGKGDEGEEKRTQGKRCERSGDESIEERRRKHAVMDCVMRTDLTFKISP